MNDDNQYDWSQFDITFYFEAHITRVFRTWTTAAGLESFFINRCVFKSASGDVRDGTQIPMVNDEYEWQFRHDFKLVGTISNVTDKQQFSFSFGKMHVDLFFKVVDKYTEVQLVQTAIDESNTGKVMDHLNCRSCWVFFMTNLQSILSTGRDLRVEHSDLVSSYEVGFLPLSQR